MILWSVLIGLALVAAPLQAGGLQMGGLQTGSLQAGGRVELELVGDQRGSALAFQEWLRVLGKAGIKSRIRTGETNGRVGIEVRGTQDRPLYVVTGVVKSRDELVLPGGRFRRRDAARLVRWLDDLARHGPPEDREPTAAFGLTGKQFDEVREALARPVGFSTKAITRAAAVDRMGRGLPLPLQLDPRLRRVLEEDRIVEELSGLSCGAALACVLRPMGFCLVPRRIGGRTVCVVVEAKPHLEVWPIGWIPEKPARKILPALFEFHNVNIQGVSAAKAMEAIGERLKVPVLVDHNALARHGVEPDKVMVTHPRRRTTYSLALRKILFQAGLKSEVRVDEAGKAFLWVSTVKPV